MDALIMGFILLIHADTMEDRGWYHTAIRILSMGFLLISIFSNLKVLL